MYSARLSNLSYSFSQMTMPTIKYKPSADCAYTQLISKIKGVHEQANISESIPAKEQIKKQLKKEPTADVEVKKISNGLMLAQYYNSDSEDEEIDQEKDDMCFPKKTNMHGQNDTCQNGNLMTSVPAQVPEVPIPHDVLCPPPELRAIIEKTASYVLKNGKEFEDILRAKNDQRFSFLQYTDPYYKFYTFKLTGIVVPILKTSANEMDSQHEKPKSSTDSETISNNYKDKSKIISKCFL